MTTTHMDVARSFDKRCEAIAVGIRRDAGCAPWEPLPLDNVLHDLGVLSCEPSLIPGMSESSLEILLGDGAEDWSAVAISQGAHTIVISNLRLPVGKRNIAVTRELAHLFLRHKPETIIFMMGVDVGMAGYSRRANVEANWLTGCLLLPAPVLDRIALGPSPESLAVMDGVTPELLHHRIRVTGSGTLDADARERFRALREYPPIWHLA